MSWLERLPPNFLGIPFGLSGLGVVWRLMENYDGSPKVIANAVFILAALVWAVLVLGSVVKLIRDPPGFAREWADPAQSCFWSLLFICPLLLATGLEPYGYGLAKVIFLVFFVPMILFGGWFTGEWLAGDLDRTKLHAGYFLPTVAGGCIGGGGMAVFGLSGLGWLSFGLGVIAWLLLGPQILSRLTFDQALPAMLIPTLAIELAPPAVAGNAYFQLHGARADPVAYALAGYALLMVLVQLRLIPVYLRLSFTPAFWAFTFPWATVAALGLRWLYITHPPGAATYEALVAGAVSLLIAAIAVRSLVALWRREFLPPPPAPGVAAPASAPPPVRAGTT